MATQKLQVYKCGKCGNIVEVMHAAGGTLVCCGQNMDLLPEKTADAATEKHVPVIAKEANGYTVTVGTTLHPMLDNHFIEWIELQVDDKVYTAFLKPGSQPVAKFLVPHGSVVKAREFCNLHGLWKA